MERKLASIQQINKVRTHPNADKLDIINILGWQCVAKKDEFKEGQLCIYVELDSILPTTNPNFAFLEKSKGRIKTVKLRGELSQGIAFPISILTDTNLSEGTDVTELLGIIKYEPPEPSHKGQNFGSLGKSRGSFPSFLRKTDEIRLQSCLGVLEEIDGKECYVSMKLDGSSCTIYSKTDISGTRRFGVCSRNMEMDFNEETPPDRSGRFCEVVHKLNIKQALTEYCEANNVDIALQGELVSEGVQGNRLGLIGSDLRFFNAYNIKEGKYLNYSEFTSLISRLNLRTVPILQEFFKYDKNIHTLNYWLEYADNQWYDAVTVGSKEGYKHRAEGIVIRPVEECYSQRLKGRMSFKVISNKYLLETGE